MAEETANVPMERRINVSGSSARRGRASRIIGSFVPFDDGHYITETLALVGRSSSSQFSGRDELAHVLADEFPTLDALLGGDTPAFCWIFEDQKCMLQPPLRQSARTGRRACALITALPDAPFNAVSPRHVFEPAIQLSSLKGGCSGSVWTRFCQTPSFWGGRRAAIPHIPSVARWLCRTGALREALWVFLIPCRVCIVVERQSRVSSCSL